MLRLFYLLLCFALPCSVLAQNISDLEAKARGQTVYWNAWAGDERTNAFIAFVGEEMKTRYGVSVTHVKLRDTAEAVTRVVAEKAAGREAEGTIDLIWINGPNFLSMKEKGLLFGPFTQNLPHFVLVDTVNKRSNVVDFTIPVEGYASPWRMAKIVFVYDSARTKTDNLPRSIPTLLDWAKANPGRLTHPQVSNFLGTTFLKQALYELSPDSSVLEKPVTDESFDIATKKLWTWYDELRPLLWRKGQDFPENGPALRQLLSDGEIDLMISFNPSEAAVSIANKLLPETARVIGLTKGTIGNTSFVAIPFNAAHKEGAMLLSNLLLDPAIQAKAQDPQYMGNLNVLDAAKLTPAQQAAFKAIPSNPAMPDPDALGPTLPEPHPSWMNRVRDEWRKRYTK
jgi:putative thiamine transport system substrate-binding protein